MSEALQITATHLEARLRERLQPVRLTVMDESHQHAGHVGANDSGFGTHFRVRVASPLFTGKTRVACHRLVYAAAEDFIAKGLHALAIEIDTAS